jgi:homoserine O-acetyltransferase
MSNLKSHTITNYTTIGGVQYKLLDISYQLFGQPLHTAPIVLINHALTGNSSVTGDNGWWNPIVGAHKVIDLNKYTVIAIDILGNGNNQRVVENYSDFILKDIAQLQNDLLTHLNITQLFACIGGSIGGGLAWELSILNPNLINYLIPIATHWQATDWIIAHNFVQDSILTNSIKPLEDARKMAMLFYRTPESLAQKFNHEIDESTGLYKTEAWLNYHGKALTKRFRRQAYRMVNHLLTTLDITKEKTDFNSTVQHLKSTVIQIGIDSDLFFKADDIKQTKTLLDKAGIKNEYHELNSIHGHDAFLIEHDQIIEILKPIFN